MITSYHQNKHFIPPASISRSSFEGVAPTIVTIFIIIPVVLFGLSPFQQQSLIPCLYKMTIARQRVLNFLFLHNFK